MRLWVLSVLLIASPAAAQKKERVFTCSESMAERTTQKPGTSESKPQSFLTFEVRLAADRKSARIKRLNGPDAPVGPILKTASTWQCEASTYHFNCVGSSSALQMSWDGNFALATADVIARTSTDEGFRPVRGQGAFYMSTGTCERS